MRSDVVEEEKEGCSEKREEEGVAEAVVESSEGVLPGDGSTQSRLGSLLAWRSRKV